jgi:NADH-quinone oxidoreductase subunit A
MGDARQKFSVLFYLVALIFLVFDLEILFLFPFAVVLYDAFLPAFWIAILFLLLLTIGFLYEWTKGVLNFVKH